MDKNIKEFSVQIYGNFEQYNQVLSKARCRIFYKYGNRNGTYITDEFANQLISTIPYTPVKGIYDGMNEDYTDHGKERNEGRIYGIVPENPNFAWEVYKDEDGVEREYACVDVLLFTAIYKEANEILNKSQSMELWEPSISGKWEIKDGQKYFVFEKACFLGLQVLGDEVEPCFEGASFFSLYKDLKKIVEEISNDSVYTKKGGTKMPEINFKLSDGAKYELLFNALNPSFNEDGTFSYGICEVYDEYAVVYNYEEGNYERVYYSKDNENDTITLGEKKKCYIVDVTENEKQALATIQALNGGTYEKIDEEFSKISELENSVQNFEQKKEEYESTISTLETEKENYSVQLEDLKKDNETLTNAVSELNEYKLAIENEKKNEIIDKYNALLSEEVLAGYREKIAEYSMDDLKKDLAVELVESKPSIFSAQGQPGGYVPKEDHMNGIEAILSKYKKN